MTSYADGNQVANALLWAFILLCVIRAFARWGRFTKKERRSSQNQA